MKCVRSYVSCNCPCYRCKRIVKPIRGRGITGKSVRFTGGLHQTQLPRSARQVVPALTATVMFYWCHSTPALLYFMTDFGLLLVWTDRDVGHAGVAVESECFFLLSLRFAKLLLRLPALRSIGLKCLEHLFFFKLIGDTPIDTFLMEMLEAPHQITWHKSYCM